MIPWVELQALVLSIFFEGSEQTYTDKWLSEQNAREARKKAFRGREYTAYEATQKQRRMETNMRAQREEVQLLEEGVDILRPTRQSSPEPKDIRGVRKGARAPSDRRKIGDGNTRKDRSRYNRAGGYEGV